MEGASLDKKCGAGCTEESMLIPKMRLIQFQKRIGVGFAIWDATFSDKMSDKFQKGPDD